MKLQINTAIIYPGHGLAKVIREDQKAIGGKIKNFYLIEVQRTKMRILVPKDRLESFSIRPILSSVEILKQLVAPSEKATSAKTWAIAYRENMEKIKTGSFSEVLSVYRQLQGKPKAQRTFGEQKVLEFTSNLLVDEIQESYKCSEVEAKEKLEDAA